MKMLTTMNSMPQRDKISAEVEAIRLSGPLFDPYLAILDENFFEIAPPMTLNFYYKIQRPVSLPQRLESIYRNEESSYRGSNSYRYRLHIGSFPSTSRGVSIRWSSWKIY